MDEKNDTINNGENQVNDMNYSFDFANQVENNAAPVTPEEPVAETTVNQEGPVTDNMDATPMPENVTAEVTETPEVVPTEVTPLPENVVEENTMDQPVDEAGAEGLPVMPEVAPVTPEAVNTVEENSEEDDLELIKDKKATKNFLIILFVVILIFIIALPFLFNVAR